MYIYIERERCVHTRTTRALIYWAHGPWAHQTDASSSRILIYRGLEGVWRVLVAPGAPQYSKKRPTCHQVGFQYRAQIDKKSI